MCVNTKARFMCIKPDSYFMSRTGNASRREKVDLSSTISRTGNPSRDGRAMGFPYAR